MVEQHSPPAVAASGTPPCTPTHPVALVYSRTTCPTLPRLKVPEPRAHGRLTPATPHCLARGANLERVQEALGSPEVLDGPRASKAAVLNMRHPLVLHVATHADFKAHNDAPPDKTSLLRA
jgi:hypothetical protein